MKTLSGDAAVNHHPLLQVQDLHKHFPVRRGLLYRVQGWIRAVDGVSFDIRPGETLGLVGESGSGKTTLGRTILRLIEPTGGKVLFMGREITQLPERQLKPLRRQMQIIFQDPLSSLDPRQTIGESITEGMRIHQMGSPREQRARLEELLIRVGLKAGDAGRYPHEFSGGQLQRVGIARALALDPTFIVADEPVSALDLSIQAQVLNLLKDLQGDLGLTYLFIAHNLAVVKHVSDRVAVMYQGRIVELSPTRKLFAHPLHPYTRKLIASIPAAHPQERKAGKAAPLEPPPSRDIPSGCRFHPHCPEYLGPQCSQEEPGLVEIEPEHYVSCWLYDHGGAEPDSHLAEGHP